MIIITQNSLPPFDWQEWSDDMFALEMQSPWAEAILNGSKTVETRQYELPPSLLGQKIYILQSPNGTEQVSSLSNEIYLNSSLYRLIGWCVFSHVKKYTTKQEFENDEAAHLVPPISAYAWKCGKTEMIYGWVVDSYQFDDNDHPYSKATRVFRSLFKLSAETETG